MSKITLDIVTPEKVVYSKPVNMVITRTPEGEIGILPRHALFVSTLPITYVRVKVDGIEERFAISGGFMEVRPDKVTILAETAESSESIDIERAMLAKERAEKRLQEKQGDLIRAELALRRALNRLDVAKWRKPSSSPNRGLGPSKEQ